MDSSAQAAGSTRHASSSVTPSATRSTDSERIIVSGMHMYSE